MNDRDVQGTQGRSATGPDGGGDRRRVSAMLRPIAALPVTAHTVVALTVVALLVIVTGTIAGCAPTAGNTAPTVPVVATQPATGASATSAPGETPGASLAAGAGVTTTAGTPVVVRAGATVTTTAGGPIVGVLPGPAIAPEGTVVDLPRRPHPLLDQAAPDFTMNRLDEGAPVTLSSFKGKPVIVNFWATWCPPCRLEMPWLQNAYNAHQDQGLVVLAVDAGEKVPPEMVHDQVSRFVDDAGLTFPMLLGDNTYDVQKQWSVLGLPATFLVNTAGKVVDFHGGAFPNQATFEDRLKAILAPAAGDN